MPAEKAITGPLNGRASNQRQPDATPAMRQYLEQKQRVGDAILLFRMGDFYETFYEDAELCSRVLGIALTSRSKADNPIPLAGIPYHALDAYLRKLVAAGYKVAISEQLEDAKQAKGVVRRDVVRIVTAGTLTDDTLLDEQNDNTLAAIVLATAGAGIACIELAGGRFEVVDVPTDKLLDELVRISPAELIIDDDHDSPARHVAHQLKEICGTSIAQRSTYEFSTHQAQRALLDHFNVSTLSGFGLDVVTPAVRAAGSVIQYLNETQKTTLSHIQSIHRRAGERFLQIDHNSFRSLEIERTLRGGTREGSLLHAIDRTVHPIGSRMLKHWLCAPLAQAEPIRLRHQAVEYLLNDPTLRSRVRTDLKNMADVERITARIALSRVNPRDFSSLSRTLDRLPIVADQLDGASIKTLAEIAKDFRGLENLAAFLSRAIKEDPAPTLKDGGVIAAGFDEQLDRWRTIGRDSQTWLAQYQRQEVERTGIASLKVGFNRVFGYYIEIPRSNNADVPPEYTRRQTVKNAERYITEELKSYETEVLTSRDKAIEFETRLFEQVRVKAAEYTKALQRVAHAIGTLDCLTGLAELARQRRYVRPQIVEQVEQDMLELQDGRHPVLDPILGDAFVPNDTLFTPNDARILIITGPNMAGKSTYIRQVALLTILAQMGSFVPARSMKWSLVDRIFARVGSSDEITRGRSTFMVEMSEAANMVHNATRRSLVILDELGRGTSTFDGLSLAWAITEYLAREIGCKSLVATHYHELTELSDLLLGVKNYNVAVQEQPIGRNREKGVVFLHRIKEGRASKSYGIYVARMAGIPDPIIKRSREVLDELQRNFARETQSPQLSKAKTKDVDQLTLFHEPSEVGLCKNSSGKVGSGEDGLSKDDHPDSAFVRELQDIDLDQITPLEALKKLTEWQQKSHS